MQNIEVFDQKYTLNNLLKSENFEEDGMFETFGNDLQLVLQTANKYPMKVWTAMDCDNGLFLVQGYHLVNRVYYMITNEDANNNNECYLIDRYEETNE